MNHHPEPTGKPASAGRACPVCGGNEAREIHRHRPILFDGHPLAGECVTAACGRCGMAFNRAAAPEEAYRRYYAELSKYAVSSPPVAGADRFAVLAGIIARLCPDRDTAILDAGCGAGGLLAALRERGYTHLAGMDPSPACVEGVRGGLGVDARVGVLAEPPFESGSQRLVLSTGVFEHLPAPGDDLGAMYRLLAPGGRAFVAVPDAGRYADFLEAPFQELNVEHINHFSPETLSQLFTLRGWRAEHLGSDALTVTLRWREPVAYGLFSPDGGAGAEPVPDRRLGESLRRYVADSTDLLARIDQRLRDELAGEDEALLWGAGQTASLLLSQTALARKKVRAVVDGNPAYAGRTMAGAPVGGPELRGDFDGPVVVSTIRAQDEVARIIREKLGWKNRLVTLTA